jgi:hypothetical protein
VVTLLTYLRGPKFESLPEHRKSGVSFLLSFVSLSMQMSGLYEGVSEEVTNGNKTAATDVICFLCVSLGSSTVQLHDSLGSRRACACSEVNCSSQNGDRASEYTTEEERPVVRFFFVDEWIQCKRYS